MAVYTKLTSQDISDFLENYNIGKLTSFKEVIDGIDNSNFIIQTDQEKFILTIFEQRINKDDLPFFINLKDHLSKKGVCCPKPIKNKVGSLINYLKNKPALIVTFLSGASLRPDNKGLYSTITEKHCYEIGKHLALLHIGVKDFGENRKNDLGKDGFIKLFDKMQDKIANYQTGLDLEIQNYLKFLNQSWLYDLEGGVVHADLFPDNVFFNENNEIRGIIDFYFSASDLFIYDLAIIINAWAFDENNNFIEEKYNQIIKGYETVRKIPKSEREFLKIALVGAAMRFLLTRLYDTFNTPKDSLVKIKNPQEYLEKIRFFFNGITQESAQ